MPTIVRIGSIAIAINIRDEHEPPHVHVWHPDGDVIVVLDEATRTVWVRDATKRMKANDVRRVASAVQDHFEMLLAAWSFYHR